MTVEGDQHLRFAVRNKTFAWYLDDHHGDGMVALNCKAPPGVSLELTDLFPDRYFVPSYLGARGWLGLRIDLPHIDWDEVLERVSDAYLLTAPKRLAAQVTSREPPH